MTYILRNVFENIWLQGHFHIYCTGYPAQFSLAHIKHTIHSLGFLASNHGALPRRRCYFLYSRLDLCQPQEVHIAILLLVSLCLVKLEAVKRLVSQIGAGRSCVRSIAARVSFAVIEKVEGYLRRLLEQAP